MEWQLLLVMMAMMIVGAAPAFIAPERPVVPTQQCSWIGDLWTEVIEFSTYGPGERKLLKERRRVGAALLEEEEEELSLESFQQAKNKEGTSNDESGNPGMEDLLLEAFRAGVAATSEAPSSPTDLLDGYALRDLLISRWGAPLDVDFQRQPRVVYCTVLPVAFGSRKCQHESEISYLMHLQGVIEILQKYNNLDSFVNFLLTTDKTPRVGTDSLPFRLQLSDEQLNKILQRDK
jgi:hypothetical protein